HDDEDGHLCGCSKPSFRPHPDDAAAAVREGLPDGTPLDMLDILCQLSRDHGIDWEIDHDESDGPVGYIRSGVADEEVSPRASAAFLKPSWLTPISRATFRRRIRAKNERISMKTAMADRRFSDSGRRENSTRPN